MSRKVHGPLCLLLAILGGPAYAQSDALTSRADYRNQLYAGTPTNALDTSLAQPVSAAFYSGSTGAAGDLRTPNDGTNGIYLAQSIIGQPVGGVPLTFYLPGITLLSPADGALFTSPATNVLSAQAWQLAFDEFVSRVDFYAAGGPSGTNLLLGSITNSQPLTNNYQLTWTNDVPGSYALMAVATDNLGGSTTSAAVNIGVIPAILVNGQYTNTHSFTFLATNTIRVTMTNPVPDGCIRYTMDGSDPSLANNIYGGPFFVSSSMLIRAAMMDPFCRPLAEVDPVNITVIPMYNLSASTPGGGSISVSPPVGPYPSNAVVTLTATPSNNWTFLGWTGDAVTNTSTFGLAMNASKAVLAIFGTTLNNLPPAGGSIQVSPKQSLYPFGSTVRLTAVPYPTNYFLKWLGDAAFGTSTSPLSFVFTGAQPTNSALFAALPPNQFALNTQIGGGDGTVSRAPFATLYTNGASVTVTATPSFGQVFVGWTGDTNGSQNPLVVVMHTNRTIAANFSTNLPPIVAITNPPDGAVFVAPAPIPIGVTATSAVGTVTSVDFYAGTNLLGTLTNQPFNFTWNNAVAGTYTLAAAATASSGLSATSALVSITVVAPPRTNPPVFLFGAPNYEVNENGGVVALTVVNNGDLSGSVSFQTVNGTAQGGSGFSGDYTITSGNVSLSGHQTTNISIQILDNYLDRPDIQFQVQLLFPSPGASLGNPSTATVTIHENDVGGATNSLLAVALPTSQPLMNGQLTVALAPPEAGGQWRFPWDLGWRTSGQTVANLVPGDYPIEFRSLSNYLAYPPTVTVTVPNNGTASFTNVYLPTFAPEGTNDTGSLTVNIGPNSPAGAGWRFLGESVWRNPGSTASSLLPDTYFIEFAPVANWSKPASQAVQVSGGASLTVLENYLSPASAAGFALPVAVATNNVTDYGHYPYGFNGQLHTDVGYGSGVVVRENIVLTAAHMVFNDQTLSFVNRAWWSFQEETGGFRPEPLAARGWFMLSGYAAQRTNDLPPVGTLGPDQSSPQSRNLDVAALYFLSPAARTGYGGYLTSDAVPNPWLTGSNLKMLVGYPVDGSLFGQVVQPGTMYVTPAQSDSRPFTLVTNQTYAASWFLSYPGNSGGPVYVSVPYSGGSYYFPAAVYLGTLYGGGSYQSVVRAIDSSVVNLINLAASEGDTGTNNTGGGVITLIAGAGSGLLAYVQVPIGPVGAVAAGAAWRVHGTAAWSAGSTYTATIAKGDSMTLEYKSIPGWNLPANNTVQVVPGQLTTVSATYTPNPAQMAVTPAGGLASSGYAGGPFSPAAITYTLTNSGGAALNWSVSGAANWLTLSASSGTLAAGASTTVTVSVNAHANSLTADSYSDTVGFTNLSGGLGNTAHSVSLNVVLPPANLTVGPAAEFASSGYTGGPFSPGSIIYGLTNSGGSNLSWTVTATANWLSLSASNGILAGGASTNVQASISAGANGLAASNYTDTVGFTNLSGGLGDTAYPVNLLVNVHPPVQLSGIRWLSSGTVAMTLQGVTGGVYSIVASTNLLTRLTNWAEVLRLTNTGGRTVFTNPPPPVSPQYYRAKEL